MGRSGFVPGRAVEPKGIRMQRHMQRQLRGSGGMPPQEYCVGFLVKYTIFHRSIHVYTVRVNKNSTKVPLQYYRSRVTVPATVLNGTLKVLNSTSKVLQRY